MRLVQRNLRSIYYCLYQGKTAILDDDGYETGETRITYSNPVLLKCNVSAAKGAAGIEMFGMAEGYDKVIVTDQMDCPIDENSVIFVDITPILEDGELINTADYMVNRVAKSLTHISYAISKVKS